MQLANPLDESTFTNANSKYYGPIKSRFSNIPDYKWEKIFGHKWMSFVWQTYRTKRKWVMLRTLP